MPTEVVAVAEQTVFGAPATLGSLPVMPRDERTIARLPHEYYDRFIAKGTKAKLNPIRLLEPFESLPEMISLIAGKPNASVFPLTSFQFTAKSPLEPDKEDTFTISGLRLTQALQYAPTSGIPALVEWLTGLQEASHGRKSGEGWELTIGSGSQDLLYKASSAVIQPGDYALIESPAYAGYIPVLQKLQANIIPIDTDANGIKLNTLYEILDNWPASKPFPKILYTVPLGSNPSGMTTSVQRRREILALARKYDFLIFEDDPYYYLYYGSTPRPESYFALEREQPEVGRVIRFDSLSKIISGGFRIGFACGPEVIIKIMNIHTSISNLQAPTFTQIIADTLLRAWGYDGFRKHAELAADFYRNRRDKFERAMRQHMRGLAEWSSPETGMFIWVKLLLKDPSPSCAAQEVDAQSSNAFISTKSSKDDSDRILVHAIESGVLPLPGISFMPDGRKTPYVRVSFSQLEEDRIEEAVKRLARAVDAARRDRHKVDER